MLEMASICKYVGKNMQEYTSMTRLTHKKLPSLCVRQSVEPRPALFQL